MSLENYHTPGENEARIGDQTSRHENAIIELTRAASDGDEDSIWVLEQLAKEGSELTVSAGNNTRELTLSTGSNIRWPPIK